jgi:hypothetical protein
VVLCNLVIMSSSRYLDEAQDLAQQPNVAVSGAGQILGSKHACHRSPDSLFQAHVLVTLTACAAK